MSQNDTKNKNNTSNTAVRYLVDRRYEGSRNADQVISDLVRIHSC